MYRDFEKTMELILHNQREFGVYEATVNTGDFMKSRKDFSESRVLTLISSDVYSFLRTLGTSTRNVKITINRNGEFYKEIETTATYDKDLYKFKMEI